MPNVKMDKRRKTAGHPSQKDLRTSENRESNLLVKHCFELCKELGITKILAFAESVQDQRFIAKCQETETVILLARKDALLKEEIVNKWHIIRLPDQAITRTDQFQLGLLFSVLNDLVEVDETVFCLTGLVGSLRLDNLLITNLKRDNKWFRKHTFDKVPSGILRSQEFYRLIDIALKFAKQGREGKPIGTIFILGKTRELKPYIKQLILNPFKGHLKSQRSIHEPDFVETLRELASLDGAFIVDPNGIVERAAVYLSPPQTKEKIELSGGYGARHTSSAALTAVTDALAVVISESSSSVMVFYDGSPILELNRI